MRNKAFTLLQAVVLLAVMGVLAAILMPVFVRPRSTHSRQSCQSNLKYIGLAILLYSQDYDEKFPLTSSHFSGWTDLIKPYMKDRLEFHCPTVQGDKKAPTSDYFYNSRLVGTTYGNPKAKHNLAYPEWTIMGGDGIPGGPTNARLSSLPTSWRNNPASPAARHMGRANYVFADGHVKPLKANAIDDGPRRKAKDKASFAVR